MLERGRNGLDWQFDSDAVVAFLGQKEEEAAGAQGEREAAIEQLALPMGHNGGPPLGEEARALRPAELLMLAKLRKLNREEEYELGRLVRVTEVRPVLEKVVATLADQLRMLPRRFGDARGWSAEQIAELRAEIDNMQRQFVGSIGRVCAEPEAANPELDFGQQPAAAGGRSGHGE